MRFRASFLVVSFVSYAVAQGCGGSTDSQGPPDSSVDSSSNDTGNGNDTSTNDTGTNDTGTGNDAGSDASDAGTDTGTTIGTWTCGNATVTDCSQCIGFTQPCVYCAVTDASVQSGACVQEHTNCFNGGIPNGFADCPCTAATQCPDDFQVCTQAGRCHTCEDNNGNNGLTCKNGGKCDAVDGGCL